MECATRGEKKISLRICPHQTNQRRHLGLFAAPIADTKHETHGKNRYASEWPQRGRNGPSWWSTLLTRWLASTLPKLSGGLWMTRSSGITESRSFAKTQQDTHFRPNKSSKQTRSSRVSSRDTSMQRLQRVTLQYTTLRQDFICNQKLARSLGSSLREKYFRIQPESIDSLKFGG